MDFIGLLFPKRCPVCHETVEDVGELVCDICRTRLPYVQQPSCRKCGKPLLSEEREYCGDCTRKRHYFKQGKAPFFYDELMRISIARFKYGGRREYAAFYAEEILRRCAKEMLFWKGDVLIPIPLHPSRKKVRGFNQAELLAKEISKRTGIPVDRTLLKRTRKTHVQKDLDDQERLTNLKNAFSVRKGNIPYKNVILIDDIYTTGSTIDEAARVLRENAVQTVYFLSICVGRGC
ncbi:MAG: ComF family protein [Lachnospiraceae bacterium]|nr:ComF family protein [Lachnospiraceae bacterium]